MTHYPSKGDSGYGDSDSSNVYGGRKLWDVDYVNSLHPFRIPKQTSAPFQMKKTRGCHCGWNNSLTEIRRPRKKMLELIKQLRWMVLLWTEGLLWWELTKRLKLTARKPKLLLFQSITIGPVGREISHNSMVLSQYITV